ncbi:MAG TPA: PilZ domain-containing protein [Bdellovibrionota bacterium]|nr:PilZ domain-containing protein [Bdellovibrionota bacterium]
MQEQREWFYPSPDGTRTVGPLSTEQVAERLRSGELKDDDFIWGTHFEDQTWKQINTVAELIPHLPKPKALPPRLPPPPIPRTGQTGAHNVAAMAAAAQAAAPAAVPAPAPEPVPTVTLAPAPAADAPKASGPSVSELVAALQDPPPAATPVAAQAPQSPLAPSSPPMPSGIVETRPASEAAAIATEQPSIAAPPADLFVPELETTNPSLRYKADPTPAPANQASSGMREIDPTLLTTEPLPMPAPVAPKASEPAPAPTPAPAPARAAAPAQSGQTQFKQKSHPAGATSEAFARTGHGHEDTERELKAVAQHADQPAEYSTENAYRRYPRVPIRTEVIMRDDNDYFRFRAIDISEKGIRIGVEDTSIFGKGEEVTITVRNAPGIGTFSCRGVVMRILKRDEGAGYGIIFMQLNPVIRRSITRYVLDQLAGKMSRIFTKGGPQAA